MSCLAVAARLTKEGGGGGETFKKKRGGAVLNRALSKGAWPTGMHEDQLVRDHGEAERFAR